MSTEVLVRLIIDLIVAVSHWLSPLVALIVLIVYRRPIGALLGRVKKGELFGQEFELEPAVRTSRPQVLDLNRWLRRRASQDLPESARWVAD